MGATRQKSAYLKQVECRQFLVDYPAARFLTLTIHENILDHYEAVRRARALVDWLRRRGLAWTGAWERQERGAWHLHLLVSNFLNINHLRSFVVARGWGQQMFIRRARSSDCNYISKYVSKGVADDCSGQRYHLATGNRSSRVGNVRFAWSQGTARAWRAGCEIFSKRRGSDQNRFWQWRNRTEILVLGLAHFKMPIPAWLWKDIHPPATAA